MKRLFNWRTLVILFLLVVFGLFCIYIFALFKEYQKRQYLANLEDTASVNVQVLRDTLLIDYLGKKRTIHLYIPPNYQQDTLSYPVLYFMDGKSLFSEKEQQGTEWQVDEHLDSIAAAGGPQAIVIGVDNSDLRMTEYKPFSSIRYPDNIPVTGKEHAEWIAHDLKTWVDSTFRTLPGPTSTTIGGASLGGLMSYYMVCTYPEIYGGAFVLSPSFWVNDQVFELHHKVNKLNELKIYMVAGEHETSIVNNAKKVYQILQAKGMSDDYLKLDIEPGLGHEHKTWQKGFAKAYPWILERN